MKKHLLNYLLVEGALFMVLIWALFLLGMIGPVMVKPALSSDWEPIGMKIYTKCDHGNRVYACEGNFGIVTVAVVSGRCGENNE